MPSVITDLELYFSNDPEHLHPHGNFQICLIPSEQKWKCFCWCLPWAGGLCPSSFKPRRQVHTRVRHATSKIKIWLFFRNKPVEWDSSEMGQLYSCKDIVTLSQKAKAIAQRTLKKKLQKGHFYTVPQRKVLIEAPSLPFALDLGHVAVSGLVFYTSQSFQRSEGWGDWNCSSNLHSRKTVPDAQDNIEGNQHL